MSCSWQRDGHGHEGTFAHVSSVPVAGHFENDSPRVEHPMLKKKATGEKEEAANVTGVAGSTVEDEPATSTHEVIETSSESCTPAKVKCKRR